MFLFDVVEMFCVLIMEWFLMFLFDVEIDRLIKEKKFFLFFLIELRGLLDMKIVFLN